MKTGERIKRRREELGWTQDYLATLLGFKSGQSISNIENGRSIPKKKLSEIAKVLGLPPEYFVADDDLADLLIKQIKKESKPIDRIMPKLDTFTEKEVNQLEPIVDLIIGNRDEN